MAPTPSPAAAPSESVLPLVYLVEDDAALSDALVLLMLSRGIACERFDGAERFLSTVTARADWRRRPGCIVMDVRMGRMSGLEAFEWLSRHHPGHPLPVIFMTGHGDITMAVEAVKNGAFDFYEKPFDDARLLARIGEAFALSAQRIAQAADAAGVQERLDRLSPRERDVMDLILAGRLNKVIAGELGISMRTVEVHRANIFEKMQVRSAVELATLLGRASG